MSDKVEILYVEDNPAAALLAKEAFKESKINNTLSIVGDGVEAMDFIRKEGSFTDAPTPDLIILDLNLPRMDGREVLAALKTDPETRMTPIVILTTSRAEEDIALSYDNHANCYIPKPVGLTEFISVVESIEKFWFAIVRLPPNK